MPTPRRDVLKLAAASAAATIVAAPRTARSAAPNDKLAFALIGCGGQGTELSRSFAAMDDIDFIAVCDVDEAHRQRTAGVVENEAGRRPRLESDLRKVLDEKSIDAVIVATPDHWHAPAAILACKAGKHVYVEKPCSHNIREGRLMVEAARQHDRVVQVGTQSRSADHVRRAMELLQSGTIGDVLLSKAWNSQLRGNIGHASPTDPPAGFDYDLWVGPAAWLPFQANRHHYTWHWWYGFGTGDMGNDGVHELDIARWGLGVEKHPSRVAALGGKLFFDDDQQFPDTQNVVFEYDDDRAPGGKRQLIYEQRIWAPYNDHGHANGDAFFGTKGYLVLGKHGGYELFGPKNKLIESRPGSPLGKPHHRNFVESIRSGQRPQADIEIGHLSATLCHLGNIAARLGRSLQFDPQAEAIVGDDEAQHLVGREYRTGHWAVPGGA